MDELNRFEREADVLSACGMTYRDWLLAAIFGNPAPRDAYMDWLVRVLYSQSFSWKLPRDEDRARNGCALRGEYNEEMGLEIPGFWEDLPCSMLEMLWALARDIEDLVLYDSRKGDRTRVWFRMMLYNAGYMTATTADEVHAISERICTRSYLPSGSGGLFPLKRPCEDQRNVDIWYQAHAYISENGLE